MGSGSSKKQPPPEGPIEEIMQVKYGLECVMCLNDWTIIFSNGSSMSMKELEKWKEKEENVKTKKTGKMK